MRKTVDTNVLVRALVDEGTEHSRVAAECLTTDIVHIPATVILETEWILRTRFRADRNEITRHFGMLLGISNVVFDDRDIVANAIDAHRHGMDFADALHLFGAGDSDAFVTFDESLRRKARNHPGAVAVMLPNMVLKPNPLDATEEDNQP